MATTPQPSPLWLHKHSAASIFVIGKDPAGMMHERELLYHDERKINY